MYSAYRQEAVFSGTGGPGDTVAGSHRAFSEEFAGLWRINARLAKDFFEGGAGMMGCLVVAGWIFAEGIRRWRGVVEACLELFYVPFSLHGNAASSEEAGEEDVEKKDWWGEHWTLALADGTSVTVREIQPEDAPALQRLVGRLSENSIRLRYFGPMDELSDKKARHFAEVDGKDRYALVALDPEDDGEVVAVVRYDRESDTESAEYAALVEDRMQGRGLGLGLTRALIEAARERGVSGLEALVLPENRIMIQLLHDLDLPEHIRKERGVKRFSIDLFPERES